MQAQTYKTFPGRAPQLAVLSRVKKDVGAEFSSGGFGKPRMDPSIMRVG